MGQSRASKNYIFAQMAKEEGKTLPQLFRPILEMPTPIPSFQERQWEIWNKRWKKGSSHPSYKNLA
jgi:hypothetical protein